MAIATLLTFAPAGLYLAVGEPVTLLKAAGAIEAAHIPVVAILTLRLNRRFLPRGLQPSVISTVAVVMSAGFFAVFAIYYLFNL